MAMTGIGGMFFRAENPDALAGWYRVHLGVVADGQTPWEQAGGPTMIVPFASNTDYWPAAKQWMINFRVSDLDELLSKLRGADIAVQTDPAWDTPEVGRFARLHDPEGNPIELWQPPVA
jgi:predicted enzyme related to lactoylglutathione lyase